MLFSPVIPPSDERLGDVIPLGDIVIEHRGTRLGLDLGPGRSHGATMLRFARGLGHGGGEELETDLDLVGGQAEWWAESDCAGTAGEQEQSTVKCQVDDPVAQQGRRMARQVLYLQPDHQPLSPNLANARKAMTQGLQPGAKLGPADLGIDTVSTLDQTQGLKCRCACNGVTAER